MRTDEEIFEEKQAFIKDKLLPLAQAIDAHIIDMTYHLLSRSPYDLEYITIIADNTDDRRVYVTGGSLLEISRDVLRTMR